MRRSPNEIIMAEKRLHCLDSTQRAETMEEMARTTYDVLVIGGGITGAGIAMDCATRGIRTALVEMQDFGAGTSSRSTKLIHGGLRYLKQFEFKLVSEVGRERAIIHRAAPHLVVPEGMLLPVVDGGTYGKLGVSVGLYIYDLLARVRREERRVMLSRRETLAREPELRMLGLRGSGWYSEYRTDDARLTMEVMKTACREGAHCLNYLKAVELRYDEEGRVCGATVEDQITGARFEIAAREVVNAAGPWVDKVRALDNSLQGKRLQHTKGVHLVVAHERLPVKESVYFDIDDGRMMFVIPRGKVTYFGTTDTFYTDDPVDPWCSQEDAQYLLDATNKMFPGVQLTFEDVRSSWAGIRPLIHEEGKGPGELSRKDEIIHSASRLVTIAGGKLTGFRKMAQRVTDLVQERLIDAGHLTVRKPCATHKVVLTGGDFPHHDKVGAWTAELAAQLELPEAVIQPLVELFGTQTAGILEEADWSGDPEAFANEVFPAIAAYAIREEGCTNLADLLIRRTGMLYFERDRIPSIMDAARSELASAMGQAATHSEEFDREYQAVVRFKEHLMRPDPVA